MVRCSGRTISMVRRSVSRCADLPHARPSARARPWRICAEPLTLDCHVLDHPLTRRALEPSLPCSHWCLLPCSPVQRCPALTGPALPCSHRSSAALILVLDALRSLIPAFEPSRAQTAVVHSRDALYQHIFDEGDEAQLRTASAIRAAFESATMAHTMPARSTAIVCTLPTVACATVCGAGRCSAGSCPRSRSVQCHATTATWTHVRTAHSCF
jgi:hypothetical protein